MVTHAVVNQPPPRVDIDEFAANVPLREGVERYDAGWASATLGARRPAGRHPRRSSATPSAPTSTSPQLRAFDRWGNRIDEVEYDDGVPPHHRAPPSPPARTPPPGRIAAAGRERRPRRHLHAVRAGRARARLPGVDDARGRARARRSPSPWPPSGCRACSAASTTAASRAGKASALFGMAMTEKQGGSDVRANTTRALADGDGRWLLTGHKWFCSAPMSDAFLVLAQTAGRALRCFLVPRVLDDGARNVFLIQRLKDKLGNRSNASSEVEFDGHGRLPAGGGGPRRAHHPGDGEPHPAGLHPTAARPGCGRRSPRRRGTSGTGRRSARRLVDQPAMTAVLADLALESEAATAVALRLARAHDADAPDDGRARSVASRRPSTKYWVCKRGPGPRLRGAGVPRRQRLHRGVPAGPALPRAAGDGDLGGLGQRHRAGCAARAAPRSRTRGEAFDAELAAARGVHPHASTPTTIACVRASPRAWPPRTRTPASPRPSVRPLVASLAVALQASLLIRDAPAAVADAFVAARLGPERGSLYGELPAALDLAALLARA